MSISTNYPQPVQVNGFECKNCTDVDYANKHIDPAHPKSGPYGVNAKTDPTVKTSALAKTDATTKTGSFITFGGALSQGDTGLKSQTQTSSTAQTTAAGQSVNVLA